ncbi:Peptidoglycan/LPS O-acetylase OafA/YrhL, contains acyltransferase and SGNH-hydrolase domains [Actinoalloteichus cyanogriseus DSM 43889]|uniref:Peptidoglycan/LPS O-acetylase OafA/YrhL, contains acyltransferase and SGNH-hydrolase domains n=1 Tax=Actinoalloteichus caeruleus DSM 43889 TaxID=1120930 RepID=A0ABT1JK51_ACTCY|nr:Peptidoglycan/LPS O-acetylase OafA/YrhL, contains acyltransferase and SGNH-hydrolase domains [Actinoalloteichus caeruleus DSM 43889]
MAETGGSGVGAPDAGRPSSPGGAPARQYLYGLDVLRVIAALFIVYRHFVQWTGFEGHPLGFRDAVNDLVVAPLRLNPHLGMVGLLSLFLISGLVITYVTGSERPGQFLLRRSFRLLPAFWVAVLVMWCLVGLGVSQGARADTPADLNSLLGSLTLANFFLTEQKIVLSVTWTLTIQFGFYLFIAATIPLARTRPWLPPAVAAVLVGVGLLLTPVVETDTLSQVRTVLTYLPVLFIGQLISLVRSGRLGPVVGTALGTAHYLLFVGAGLGHDTLPDGPSSERTLLIMVLVTVLLLRARGGLARARPVSVLAKRTYAVYLAHIPAGFPILRWVTAETNALLGVLCAVLATAVAAEALYRFVEMPVHRWYRRRERARRAPTPSVAPGSDHGERPSAEDARVVRDVVTEGPAPGGRTDVRADTRRDDPVAD